MQIRYVIIKVDDQEKALEFYTSILGFKKKADVMAGSVRWLTVSSPDGIAGTELVLEPNHFEPAKAAQKTLYDAGFPAAVLSTADIEKEHQRLTKKGVKFLAKPRTLPNATFAPFDDNCGNIIMLVQPAT